jgi:hypothetical protein
VSLAEIDLTGPEPIATRLIVRAEGVVSCRYSHVSLGDVFRVRVHRRLYSIEVRGIDAESVNVAVFRRLLSTNKNGSNCFA